MAAGKSSMLEVLQNPVVLTMPLWFFALACIILLAGATALGATAIVLFKGLGTRFK